MSEAAKGILAMVIACSIWGITPLYWVHLAHVPAPEIIAHRTLWSAVTFLIVLTVQGRLGVLWQVLSNLRNVVILLIGTLMVSLNWLTYVWAVGQGKATEASLGYYLFPLVAVLAGRVIYGERLSPL